MTTDRRANVISNDNEPVLTVSDLMRRWKCDRKTILSAITAGKLQAFKPGSRSYRVTLEEVKRYEKAA
jgi:excisionase family DNA binding protein